MNNMLTRTITGLLFAIVMVGSILYKVEAFALLMSFFVRVGASEVFHLFVKSKKRQKDKFLFILPAVLLYVFIALFALNIIDYQILSLGFLLFLFPFLHALFNHRLTMNVILTAHWTAFIFVAMPAAIMLFFFNESLFGALAGPYLLLLVIGFIWINDIFAYLVGVRFGKHRLYEKVSPKKSWEGSFGGLFFTMLTAWGVSAFTGLIGFKDAVWIAVIVVITGSLGDLIESKIKREAGVKDSGKMMPGHGGVLDRFDAAFFAIPFVFVYLLMTYK